SLSNELAETKLLLCATDTRTPAENFAILRNDNVSYFIGVTADYGKPDSILAGDRNITTPLFGAGSVVHAGSNDVIEWTGELHEYRGNLLFADGRVELFNNAGLLGVITHSPVSQNTFLPPIPSPPNPDTSAGASGAAGFASISDSNSGAPREDIFQAKPAAPA